MILTNRMYDILKWIALILLPGLSVFYVALAVVWGLPYPGEIAGTIAAIDVFLAALLGVSTNMFKVNHQMYRLNLVKLVGDISNNWIMSNSIYDVLTWVAQFLLPGLAALYAALSGFWNLPFANEIVATIMAVDAFLGALLGFSTAQFHKKVAQACVTTPEAWATDEE